MATRYVAWRPAATGQRRASIIAPGLGGIGLVIGIVLMILNYNTLTGSTATWVNALPLLLPAAAVIGAVMARHQPAHEPSDDDTPRSRTSRTRRMPRPPARLAPASDPPRRSASRLAWSCLGTTAASGSSTRSAPTGFRTRERLDGVLGWGGGVGTADGGVPDQDAGCGLVQPPALGLLAAMVVAAQRGQIALAGPPAVVMGLGVV